MVCLISRQNNSARETVCSVSKKFDCLNFHNFHIFFFTKDSQPKTYSFMISGSDFDPRLISFRCRLDQKKNPIVTPGNHTPYHAYRCSLCLTFTLTITVAAAVAFTRSDVHAHAHAHARRHVHIHSIIESTSKPQFNQALNQSE